MATSRKTASQDVINKIWEQVGIVVTLMSKYSHGHIWEMLLPKYGKVTIFIKLYHPLSLPFCLHGQGFPAK